MTCRPLSSFLLPEADVDEALFNTLTRWGHDKYEQYLALIEEALEALATIRGRARRSQRSIRKLGSISWANQGGAHDTYSSTRLSMTPPTAMG